MSNYAKVREILQSQKAKNVFQKILPSNMSVDGWLEMALAVCKQTKDIEESTVDSTIGALQIVASLGLRLEGLLGQAYLTVRSCREKRDGKWVVVKKETQVQIGYKGLLAIAWKDQNVRDIEAEIVYQNDHLEFKRGTNAFIEHSWDVNQDCGNFVAMYSGLRMKDGYYSFRLYSAEVLYKHRLEILQEKGITYKQNKEGKTIYYRQDYRNGLVEMTDEQTRHEPWIGHTMAMFQKTVLRWSSKLWNLSVDFDKATDLIALEETNISQRTEVAAELIIKDEGVDLGEARNEKTTMSKSSEERLAGIKAQMLEAASKRNLKKEITEKEKILADENHVDPVDGTKK